MLPHKTNLAKHLNTCIFVSVNKENDTLIRYACDVQSKDRRKTHINKHIAIFHFKKK